MRNKDPSLSLFPPPPTLSPNNFCSNQRHEQQSKSSGRKAPANRSPVPRRKRRRCTRRLTFHQAELSGCSSQLAEPRHGRPLRECSAAHSSGPCGTFRRSSPGLTSMQVQDQSEAAPLIEVQLGSRRYLCARKSPHALHPVHVRSAPTLGSFPCVCL